jgi:hypothetical protein
MVDVVQALDGWNRRPGAGGDDHPVAAQPGAVDVDLTGRPQGGVPVDHRDPIPLESQVVLGRRDARHRHADRGHGVGERLAPGRRGQQRLGRHTARERAIATHRPVLHQRRPRTPPGPLARSRDTGGTPTDHHQVELTTHGFPSTSPSRRARMRNAALRSLRQPGHRVDRFPYWAGFPVTRWEVIGRRSSGSVRTPRNHGRQATSPSMSRPAEASGGPIGSGGRRVPTSTPAHDTRNGTR